MEFVIADHWLTPLKYYVFKVFLYFLKKSLLFYFFFGIFYLEIPFKG